MRLDPVTLAACSTFLAVIMGGLLVLSWLPNRREMALPVWGIAFGMLGAGMSLLGLHSPDPAPAPNAIAFGNAFVIGSLGLQYVGCRIFNGRPARLYLAAIGPGIYFAYWFVAHPSFMERVVVASLVLGGYMFMTAWELLRQGAGGLIAQRMVGVLYLFVSSVYVARGLLAPGLSYLWPDFLASRWSVSHAIIVFVHVPLHSVLLLSMSKEKLERTLRTAADTDSLTGIANRGAFLRNAERMVRSGQGGAMGCILFDLDDFKGINDRHGHHAGDRVLASFAGILSRELPSSLVGRLGGEEFAALVAGDLDEIEAAAERVRTAFRETALTVGEQDVRTTVSVGYAVARDGRLEETMGLADMALYRAKANGRDLVVGAA